MLFCKDFLLKASFDGLGGGAGGSVSTVCALVLLVVQEPARIREASHLDPRVAQTLQQLSDAIHIQQNPCAASTFSTET